MKMHDVIDRLIARVPRDVEWSRGESYGAYNVQGNPDVTKVLYCVTPTVGVRAYMRQHGYQLLISHHPYVAGHGIPQFIAHTALDCAEGGLNDMWRDALDVRQARHFDGTLGWAGEIAPLPFDQLVERCRAFAGGVVGQQYRAAGTDETIGSVVICTGLGGLVLGQAAATGADCYILGENTCPPEQGGFKAIIEVGHTLSEWIGVRVFQQLLAPHGIQVDGAPFDIDRFGNETYEGIAKRKG